MKITLTSVTIKLIESGITIDVFGINYEHKIENRYDRINRYFHLQEI
jgi:hypothetical protein